MQFFVPNTHKTLILFIYVTLVKTTFLIFLAGQLFYHHTAIIFSELQLLVTHNIFLFVFKNWRKQWLLSSREE